jgi:hypothetical protein
LPRNSSTGVYEAPTNSVNPAVANQVISSTDFNAMLTDVETALSTTAATTRALWAQLAQVQDGGALWGGTAGGTADARTISLTPAITAYATGMVIRFVNGAAANATTTPTLAVNGLSAITIVRPNGVPAEVGDMPAGGLIQGAYDGTNFRLASTPSSPLAVSPNNKSTDYPIVVADRGTVLRLTGATSRTFTTPAAATAGIGWWCYVEHAGDDTAAASNPVTLTIDGNSAETVDGAATITDYRGALRLLYTDGSNWTTMLLAGGMARFVQTGTFTWPSRVSGAMTDVIGGGGGGGRGANAVGAGSSGGAYGGGGGGARAMRWVGPQAVNTATTATVGTGGTGATTASGSGNSGGNSSFLGVQAFGGAGSPSSNGGGGGGTGSAGSTVNGGAPIIRGVNAGFTAVANSGTSDNPNTIGGGGGGTGSGSSGTSGSGEWGGGAGGWVASTQANLAGGSSIHGGGAGGAGMWDNGGLSSGGVGGVSGAWGAGGGAAGGVLSGSAGTNGTDGTSRNWAAGDGGGGGGRGTTGAGGAGGAGGTPGGGGGGGGMSESGNSGNGGNGARGEVRVWYW